MSRIFNGKIASMKCGGIAGDVFLVAHEKDDREQLNPQLPLRKIVEIVEIIPRFRS